jgi:hypothetical protein
VPQFFEIIENSFFLFILKLLITELLKNSQKLFFFFYHKNIFKFIRIILYINFFLVWEKKKILI